MAMGGLVLADVLKRLKTARNVVIFSHQRPDPDALGSQSAAAFLLQHLGATKIARAQFGEPPVPYRFLLEAPGEVVTWSEAEAARLKDVDTVLAVDTCTYQQMEPAAAFLKAHADKVVAVDHHLSRDNIGPLLYTDTDAAACVEIMWELMSAAGVPMSKASATPLLAGLVGDTGWFRFDSVRPLTHKMAGDLIAHVDPSQLYERLMQNESKAKLGLMQRALSSVRWSSQDKYAAMLLKYSDFTETGANQSHTEYLVDMPMIVETVEVVSLMSELPDGKVRVSLRSKHDVNVNKICNKFGGGGHAKAAGCRLDGPLDAAYEKLRAAVAEALESH